MEINFYIWCVLTIAVTAYSWVLIAKWAKRKEAKQQSLEN